MDIVTLGAALNGAKTQTEDIVNSHFVEGANITIVDNVDGTQTINATGTISVSGADVVLTGYEKASSVEAIAETNTANEAIGILEKALDGKINAIIDSEDTEMLVLSNS